jgi:phosphoglycerol transferase
MSSSVAACSRAGVGYTIPNRPTLSNLRKDASGYGAAVGLTLIVLIATLQLWRADLTVPLRYTGGDGTLYLMLVKSTVENGWFLDEHRLGAPDGQNLRDFPMPDVLHYGIIKLLGYVFRNPIVTANLYYLLPYPLAALTTYFVLRRFALGRLAALAGGVLYACAPYHFCRMIGHPMLAAYYLLPLSTWAVVRIFLNRTDFVGNNVRGRLWSWEAAGAVLVCALTAVAGVYYAFFTCFFLIAAGANASFRDRQWMPLVRSAACIFVIVGVMGAALAPNIIYLARNGKNHEAAFRYPAEADIYGLNVSEMLLPIEGHRIHFLARRREKYMEPPRDSASEGPVDSPLGFAASLGFLCLIARFLWRRRDKGDGVEDALAYLTVAAVGLAGVGGLGASFNFYVTPMIRCYNRISIYIAFFALAGLFLMLERLANRFLKRGSESAIYVAGLAVLLLVGAFDQTSPQYIPNYGEAKRQFSSDAEFGRRMESALPASSLVYQLPYVPFPEAGPTPTLPDYELLRPYFHTHTLRWSYGGMKGRPAGLRQAALAQLPLAESLPQLAVAGFRGVYLDRAGYADNGVAVEAELSRLLGAEPQISQTGRQVFFELSGYVQQRLESVP